MSWIQVNTELASKPQVLRLARLLKMDKLDVIGRLVMLWSWADTHTTDGDTGLDCTDLDELARKDGFAAAMVAVGWLRADDDGLLSIVDFHKYNGTSAKARMRDARKKQKKRMRDTQVGDGIPPDGGREHHEEGTASPLTGDDVPKASPPVGEHREEKRREEYINGPRAGKSTAADACASTCEHAHPREAGNHGSIEHRDSGARDFSENHFSAWLDAMKHSHPVLATYARIPDDILRAAAAAAEALPNAPRYAKLLRAYMDDARTTEDRRGEPIVRPRKLTYYFENLAEWIQHAQRWAKETHYRPQVDNKTPRPRQAVATHEQPEQPAPQVSAEERAEVMRMAAEIGQLKQ